MDKNSDFDGDDTLFAEANRWFFRMQAENVTAAEKAAFAHWLAADPRHAKAMDEVKDLLGLLQNPAKASHGATPIGQAARAFPRRSRLFTVPRLAMGLAAVLAVSAYVQGPAVLARWNADLSTYAGQRLSRQLADGTKLELNSDTALKFELTEKQRLVTLLRGEVFIDIAPDPRPLIVKTDAGEMRDIGTSFNVAESSDQTVVVVATGIVDVTSRGGEGARVSESQRVAFSAIHVSAVTGTDLEDDLAWRRGQVVFRQQRLADVVATLNRYRTGRIVIVNPWIRDLNVSGTFDIDRSASAIDALENVLGVKATSLTPYLVILR